MAPAPFSNDDSRAFPRALAALALLYLACLPLRDFWYPDEPDMAEITRQMVLRGDPLQLWLFQKPFDDYPPLYFWITSAVARFGGFSEFVLRLPTALSGLALLGIVGAWVRRRRDDGTAALCVLSLGTCYLFLWQSINMHLDMLLALGVGAAIVALDVARDAATKRARLGWIALAGVAMGAAALTKGPLGLLLPCAISGIDALVARRRGQVPAVLGAAAVGSLFLLGWAFAFAGRAGEESVAYFFGSQNIERFLGGKSHDRPPYYYLVNIWIDLLPWSLLLIPALRDAWRGARRGDPLLRVLLVWFAFGMFFFSLSSSKRSVYLLPIMPAAGVLLGLHMHRLGRGVAHAGAFARAQVRVLLGVLVAAGVVGLAALPWFDRWMEGPAIHEIALAAAALLMLSCAYAGRRLVLGQPVPAVRLPALVPLVLPAWFAVYGVFYPSLDEPMSAKPDARWLREVVSEAPDEDLTLAFFQDPEDDDEDLPKESSALQFYGGFPLEMVNSVPEITSFFGRHPGAYLLVEDKKLDELEELGLGLAPLDRRVVIGDDVFFVMPGP